MREVVTNVVGRYALGQSIAAGGMATLHLGRIVGSAGFARTVAIKRLHPQFCADPSFVEAFADEARLAARIRHPNVVPTLDVVATEASANGPGELLLVMEYVDGEALSALSRQAKGPIPLPIIVAIVSEMLHGLHSAHEAKSESGEALGIVHRDVSPQNLLVGADGVARLVDFGIARATGRVGTTNDGELKGKIAYMAPEQLRREEVTRKVDIFAAGVVLWELLTGQRLFAADNPGATIEKILVGWVAPPSSIARDLPAAFDEIALRALDADPKNRFETARDMAVALEDAAVRALARDVAGWVEATAEGLQKRRELVASAERSPGLTGPNPSPMHDDDGLAPDSMTATSREDTLTNVLEASISPAESERTVTAFAAGTDPRFDAPPPFASSRGPNVFHRRRVTTGTAAFIFVFAAVVTVIAGALEPTLTPRSAFGASARTPAFAPLPLEPLQPLQPAPPAPAAAPTPPPVMFATAVAVTPPPPPPVAQVSPPVRRTQKARPQVATPGRTPCVAKLDPTTGRTIYKGDCEGG